MDENIRQLKQRTLALLPKSQLVKKQCRFLVFEDREALTKEQKEYLERTGQTLPVRVEVCYDDECSNGRNSFSIVTPRGADHETVAMFFPELRHLLRWHLCYSDGPFYYFENTLYHMSSYDIPMGELYIKEEQLSEKIKIEKRYVWSGELEEIEKVIASHPDRFIVEPAPNKVKLSDVDAARRTAIAPDATEEQLSSPEWLAERLPALMEEFKRDIEAFGFTY